ncbi:MAG: nitroreductase [Clostridium sp.]|nr:nitroreductase [Clostridium sp.]
MLNKKLFKAVKPLIEQKLRDYPYYQVSLEMSGLGTAVNPNKIIDKTTTVNDPTFKSAVQEEYMRTVVNAVNLVNDKLDYKSKKIIENAYFFNLDEREVILNDLNISKHKYYMLKDAALYKYGIAFGLL